MTLNASLQVLIYINNYYGGKLKFIIHPLRLVTKKREHLTMKNGLMI